MGFVTLEKDTLSKIIFMKTWPPFLLPLFNCSLPETALLEVVQLIYVILLDLGLDSNIPIVYFNVVDVFGLFGAVTTFVHMGVTVSSKPEKKCGVWNKSHKIGW